jgi:hypothetical protein
MLIKRPQQRMQPVNDRFTDGGQPRSRRINVNWIEVSGQSGERTLIPRAEFHTRFGRS